MKNIVILKSDTFKYPTKEERQKIRQRLPKINRLTFDYKSTTIEILNNSTIEDATKNEDIYWWNNCLNNRLGKLTETFIYVMTHFERTSRNDSDDIEYSYTDEILLNYYIEIFYYYFFSTRDVLGQLLNLILDLGIDEHKIFLNEQFTKKIQSLEIKTALSTFLNSTHGSYNTRNSFNHRFTPTSTDFRAKKNIIQVDNTISFYSPEEIKIETFIADIDNLMTHFGTLMNELDKEIKLKYGC